MLPPLPSPPNYPPHTPTPTQHPLASDMDTDALRCALCGKRFNDAAALQKHFKQLHEREHKKRATRGGGAQGRRSSRYLESEKADRCAGSGGAVLFG